MKLLTLHDFPIQAFDKLRYADTDRQGHVNNANFSTFLETGRVSVQTLRCSSGYLLWQSLAQSTFQKIG